MFGGGAWLSSGPTSAGVGSPLTPMPVLPRDKGQGLGPAIPELSVHLKFGSKPPGASGTPVAFDLLVKLAWQRAVTMPRDKCLPQGRARAWLPLCAQSPPLPCGFHHPPLLRASSGMRLGRVHRQGRPRRPLSGWSGRRATGGPGRGPSAKDLVREVGQGWPQMGRGGDRPGFRLARGLAFFPRQRAEGVDLGEGQLGISGATLPSRGTRLAIPGTLPCTCLGRSGLRLPWGNESGLGTVLGRIPAL